MDRKKKWQYLKQKKKHLKKHQNTNIIRKIGRTAIIVRIKLKVISL